MRCAIVGLPSLYPNAIAMSFEMATYGLILGMLYNRRCNIFIALLIAMLIGRIIWGSVMFFLLLFLAKNFTFDAFLAGAFINAVPGTILQLILVPIIAKRTKGIGVDCSNEI